MPVQLAALLKELGIEADTAVARGWNALSNGSLVSAAAEAKFTALLTRDRLFGESAHRCSRFTRISASCGLHCRSCVRAGSWRHFAQLGRRRELSPRRDGRSSGRRSKSGLNSTSTLGECNQTRSISTKRGRPPVSLLGLPPIPGNMGIRNSRKIAGITRVILTMRFGLFRNFDTAGRFVMECGN
jgi:hypothetical protein